MNPITRSIVAAVLLSATSLYAAPSHAYTECPSKVRRIFVGDEGYLWVFLQNGQASYLIPTDPDLKNTLALASLAFASDSDIVIRYGANGVPCEAGGIHNDVVGFFLVR